MKFTASPKLEYKTESVSNFISPSEGSAPESFKAKFQIGNIPMDYGVDREKTMQTVSKLKDNSVAQNKFSPDMMQ